MPWKNGGGATTEIIAAPAGASFDSFDWRISMARVATDGPFSQFVGIDRTLAVVKGNGLVLTIDDGSPVTLDQTSDPISFRGDARTSARLLAGEITDLNVMTRRSRFGHCLQRIREPTTRAFDHTLAVILSLDGQVTVTSGSEIAILDYGDAAELTPSTNKSFRISPAIDAACYLVLFVEHRDQPG
jgi:environmental stress-induced protein Ves